MLTGAEAIQLNSDLTSILGRTRGGLERPDGKPAEKARVSPFYWAAFVLSGDWR
jgi:hypothetical protein